MLNGPQYRQALNAGFAAVRENGLLTNRHIIEIQKRLELNEAGFRKLPGTVLKTETGRTVYTPPLDPAEIITLMRELERFINDDDVFDADPLPVLYLSRHIVRTKTEYSRLIQAVHDGDAWEPWVIYMLMAMEDLVNDLFAKARLIDLREHVAMPNRYVTPASVPTRKVITRPSAPRLTGRGVPTTKIGTRPARPAR